MRTSFCRTFAIFLLAIVAVDATAQDAAVEKVGDNYQLKVADKVLTQSAAEIRDAKAETLPRSKTILATWKQVSPADDGPPLSYYAVQLANGDWSRPKSTNY